MPISTWPDIPSYQKLHKFAHNLPLSNAATERIVKRTYDYANFGGKSESDFQSNLKVVGMNIARVPNRKTKKGLVKAYGQID